jgi:hypothetical protein
VKFSPPDKSFSIVLPRKPIYQHSDLNYDEQGVFDGNMRADDYDFSPNDSGTTSLITVFHLARPKSRQQFDKECDSIMEVIAGDDKQFDKRASLTINGPARPRVPVPQGQHSRTSAHRECTNENLLFAVPH